MHALNGFHPHKISEVTGTGEHKFIIDKDEFSVLFEQVKQGDRIHLSVIVKKIEDQHDWLDETSVEFTHPSAVKPRLHTTDSGANELEIDFGFAGATIIKDDDGIHVEIHPSDEPSLCLGVASGLIEDLKDDLEMMDSFVPRGSRRGNDMDY